MSFEFQTCLIIIPPRRIESFYRGSVSYLCRYPAPCQTSFLNFFHQQSLHSAHCIVHIALRTLRYIITLLNTLDYLHSYSWWELMWFLRYRKYHREESGVTATWLKCFIKLLNPLNNSAELVGLPGPIMVKNIIKSRERKITQPLLSWPWET